MDRQLEVGRQRGHFDREDALGNELPGAGSGETYPEYPLRLRIDDELGQAVWSVNRDGATNGRPRELGNLHFLALLRRLGLRETAPGHLGVGKDDGRNRLGL